MKRSIIAIVFIMMAAVTFCQEKIDNKKENLANRIAKESKYYGMIVGIDQYREDGLPGLDNPINDAEKLYQVLTSSYNFKEDNIVLMKNATRVDIIRGLDELTRVVTSDDNVLIFYAGHGFWDADVNIGYWLPSDANKATKVNWLPNSQLMDYIKTIKSKHTLLIVDASFSGSIFKARSAMPTSNPDLPALYEQPSRKAITSCALSEAPENGVFMKYLIRRLEENEEPCLSSEQLYSSFRIAVLNNSNAIPRFGEIGGTGDQGGDFIFIRR